MFYTYKSKIGVLTICQDKLGGWTIAYENDTYGHYSSPEQAADDVYSGVTGIDDWDSIANITEPCDLSEWEEHH